MDTRWRNLIIGLVIIVLLLIIFFVGLPIIGVESFFKTPSDINSSGDGDVDFDYAPGEAYHINDCYFLVFNSFIKNDVNLDKVRTLEFFGLDDDGKVVWLIPKQNLVNLQNDLTNFSNKYPSCKGHSEILEFNNIYVNAINAGILFEDTMLEFDELIESKENICNLSVDEYNYLVGMFKYYYNFLDNLAIQSLNFSFDYDEEIWPLDFDLDQEYSDVLLLIGFLEMGYADCGVVIE